MRTGEPCCRGSGSPYTPVTTIASSFIASVDPQRLVIWPRIPWRPGHARHLVFLDHRLEPHVARGGGRIRLLDQPAQRKARPGHVHRPAFKAAEVVDPLLVIECEQVVQVEGHRVVALPADLDLPRLHLEVAAELPHGPAAAGQETRRSCCGMRRCRAASGHGGPGPPEATRTPRCASAGRRTAAAAGSPAASPAGGACSAPRMQPANGVARIPIPKADRNRRRLKKISGGVIRCEGTAALNR